MAYDVGLAERLRSVLGDEPGMATRRMFGGLAFLLDGTLVASASSRGGMLLRVDPARTAELAAEPGVEPFEMRGRAMAGWLHVLDEAIAEDEDLERWVAIGLAHARSLPPKR